MPVAFAAYVFPPSLLNEVWFQIAFAPQPSRFQQVSAHSFNGPRNQLSIGTPKPISADQPEP